MSVEVTKNGDQCSVSIDGEMTINMAAVLKNEIFGKIAWAGDVSFDLSGVSEMDTSGFQLLMLAKKEAASNKCGFSIKSHSAATSAVMDLFNMKEEFDACTR